MERSLILKEMIEKRRNSNCWRTTRIPTDEAAFFPETIKFGSYKVWTADSLNIENKQ